MHAYTYSYVTLTRTLLFFFKIFPALCYSKNKVSGSSRQLNVFLGDEVFLSSFSQLNY